MGLSEDEHRLLKPLCLLTDKSLMYIANVNEKGFTDNPYLDQVEQLARAENSVVVPICAAIEAELADMNAEEKQVFLADMGLEEPGLNRVIRAGYKLLGLQTFFTVGPRKCAPGRSAKAHMPPRPRESSIRISKRVLSVPRPSPSTISCAAMGSTARVRPGNYGSKARTMWCTTAMSCTSGLTCSIRP